MLGLARVDRWEISLLANPWAIRCANLCPSISEIPESFKVSRSMFKLVMLLVYDLRTGFNLLSFML